MATLSRRLVSRKITWIPSVFCRNQGTSSEPPPASSQQSPKAEPPTVNGPEPILNQTDNTKYQAEQVHHYNPMSFYDIEREMDELRLKQPSNKEKFEPSV